MFVKTLLFSKILFKAERRDKNELHAIYVWFDCLPGDIYNTSL